MSGIDYSKLRSLTARRIISALKKDGFVLDRSEGSHYLYLHPDGRRVTVFYHGAGTFKLPTLKSMIEYQAKWRLEDLKRLKLVK